jgi:hypothetical protein
MSDSTIPRLLSPIWIAVRHGFGLVNVALREVSPALWKNAAGYLFGKNVLPSP